MVKTLLGTPDDEPARKGPIDTSKLARVSWTWGEETFTAYVVQGQKTEFERGLRRTKSEDITWT